MRRECRRRMASAIGILAAFSLGCVTAATPKSSEPEEYFVQVQTVRDGSRLLALFRSGTTVAESERVSIGFIADSEPDVLSVEAGCPVLAKNGQLVGCISSVYGHSPKGVVVGWFERANWELSRQFADRLSIAGEGQSEKSDTPAWPLVGDDVGIATYYGRNGQSSVYPGKVVERRGKLAIVYSPMDGAPPARSCESLLLPATKVTTVEWGSLEMSVFKYAEPVGWALRCEPHFMIVGVDRLPSSIKLVWSVTLRDETISSESIVVSSNGDCVLDGLSRAVTALAFESQLSGVNAVDLSIDAQPGGQWVVPLGGSRGVVREVASFVRDCFSGADLRETDSIHVTARIVEVP